MREDELRAAFDRQAAGYDEQWDKMAPIRDGLYLLVESVLAAQPADAREDVAILAPATVASVIESGGFEPPVQFFQAGLLHAWFSRRSSGSS